MPHNTAHKKIWVAATYDTKSVEANYLSSLLTQLGVSIVTVDLSTEKRATCHVDISADHIANYHPEGAPAVFTGDRGQSIAGMTDAFVRFVQTREDVGAIIGIGGSGGTALITAAMQALPVGTPKLMVSTVASGDVSSYVGSSDICMMYSVTDIAGLNRISKRILSNAAGAIAGAFTQSLQPVFILDDRPAVGLTMFGVTTPCIQQIRQTLDNQYDCVTFHATGTGGQSMEKLVDNGFFQGVIDITTTEVADFLFGGVMPCTTDRFGACARTKVPYIVSCGALDMVNFSSIDSVPNEFRHRNLYSHNAQVTLMRTTPEENMRMGRWIAERLNLCEGPVCMILPEGGLSALDADNQPFWDPKANAALFDALETHFHKTENRRLIRTPHHINSDAFSQLVIQQFLSISQPKITHHKQGVFDVA